MSKYIKDHSLSVGYNNTGQEFFDILHKYEKYIHSYFFSLLDRLEGDIFNRDTAEFLAYNLYRNNTYNIPANILFNNKYSFDHWEEIIDLVYNKINLKYATVYNPIDGYLIKNKYPDIDIHLSVRFWDWNYRSNMNEKLNNIPDYISTINISGVYSYNDFEFIKACKNKGFKTKIIANEGCIINRDTNYSTFPECENLLCWNEQHKICNTNCIKIRNKYQWMELATVDLYKESLKYYDIDYIKLATRFNDNILIHNLLEYWTSDLYTGFARGLNINEKNYGSFLEYIEYRSKCSGMCFTCKKCEYFYNKLKGDIE